ncbi:MAG: glycosyltransferase [Alphaproteobacteria bacterium]
MTGAPPRREETVALPPLSPTARAFYAAQAKLQAIDPADHYDRIGRLLGIPPHPFFHPGLMQALHRADRLPGEDRAGAISPLFDARYCAKRMGVRADEALAHALERLQRNEWVDFHPLLIEADFLASRFPSIACWIEVLSNPGRSLDDLAFSRFMPRFYRATADRMEMRNELVDYLVNGHRSGGLPHVFFEPWFAAQFNDERPQPPQRPDLWLDMLEDVGQFGHRISLFFEPLQCNHEISLLEGRVENQHPLERFLSQTGPLVPPHKEVLPTALAYAFLDRPIDACAPEAVSPRDVLAALEVALTGSAPEPADVSVSVCILNYNKPTHTILSAIAAARNAPEGTEVLVLDNGSNPKDWEIIRRMTRAYGNIRVIRSERNLFFGEGNNVLLDMARGEILLFLNNDAYVGPGTIGTMVDHLARTPDTAACGVTFLFPNLDIQEAGGLVSDCGQQMQLHKNTPFALQRAMAADGPPEPTQYVSSACFCVRRRVLDDVGGYDARYEPLYFEDTDLCRRMTGAGYRIDYLPGQYVIHYENATTREYLGKEFMAQIQKNRQLFRKRWLYRPMGYRPRSMPGAVGRAPDPARPKAVVYTPYDIRIGGGERYILSVAAALAEDYNVVIATRQLCSKTRLAFALDDLRIEITGDMILNVALLDDVMAEGDCDLMIVMGNELIPPVPFFGRRNLYHCQFPFPGHHEDRWQHSRLAKVDGFIVNSQFTRHHVEQQLRGLATKCPVHVTYAPVNPVEICAAPKSDQGLRIVNVGRFDPDGHSKRQDVVLEIFKAALATAPDLRLSLVGGAGSSQSQTDYLALLKDQAKGLPVEFLVNASRSDLEQEIARSGIYLHACGFDQNLVAAPERQEHFGIAVVEGMMAGLIPIVFDNGGPAEIVKGAGVGYRYTTRAEAVNAVLAVHAMAQDERAALGRRARDYAMTFADDRFRDRVRAVILDQQREAA